MVLPPPSVLRVIEPMLKGPSGHYAEFVRALAARGSEHLAAIEVVADARATDFIPTLGSATPVRAHPLPAGALGEARAMRDALREPRRTLVLTANASHALLAEAVRPLDGARLALLPLFVHWPLEKPSQRLALALSPRVRRRALFLAPTAGIARSLESARCAKVAQVAYPATRSGDCRLGAPFRHLLMAGAARINKGLDLLVELAEAYAKEGRDLPLLVQVSPKHVDRHGSREDELVARLIAAGYRGLVADPKAPDRTEYAARYEGALVLAPYAREKFAHGVSGIVLDALLHGAPVVATKRTWAGDVVERFGAGVTFAERSGARLGRAIDEVLSDWPRFARNAAEASEVLAREHDPARIALLLRAHC
ncbi:MAG: hypothetical protein ACO31E_00365 [Phycisphaerales bacterium]